MLIIRTAFKNIIGSGKRTWLNVAVLSLILVIMVAYNGIMDGWIEESRRETILWETGEAQLWHPAYDRFDVFTLQDAHGIPPESLHSCMENGTALPVLVQQGTLYPQGRMQNILIKGIAQEQKLLSIPSEKLTSDGNDIPALIGSRMAQASGLRSGDRVMLRWRDKNGVFDAREILITHVFDTKVPNVDGGQLWIRMEDFRKMTGMEGEATYLVLSSACPLDGDTGGWSYKDQHFLLADIDLMVEANRVESVIIFSILLAIALLAVFDTQTLSIFRRQKEIGTYVALGMSPHRVMGLFTLEGTAYSILAVLAGAVWGTPLLWLFARVGMPLPDAYTDMGIAIGNVMSPVYLPVSVLQTILIVVGLSALISFLPARKIARQNMVLALKGKIA